MKRLTILTMILALCLLGGRRGPDWLTEGVSGGAGAAGGGSTDFTLDADFIGCWFVGDWGTSEAEAETDYCTAEASTSSDTLTFSGDAAFASSTTVPSGSVSGSDSVSMDGNNAGSTSQRFAIPNTSEFATANYSYGCWLRPSQVSGDWRIVYSTSFDDRSNVHSSGYFRQDQGGVNEQTSASTAVVDVWTHFAVIYDGSNIKTYIDGVEDCSGGCVSLSSDTPAGDGSTLFSDRFGTESTSYGGLAYECFYSDTAISQATLCEIVENGLDGSADQSARETAYGSCD